MKKPDETFGQTEDVASATECTGLMPALPRDAQQDADCAELYGIHKAAKPRPKYRRR